MRLISPLLASVALLASLAASASAQGGQYTDLTVKASCSSSPPSVTITNSSSSPARIVSVSLEFRASDLAKLRSARSPQELQRALKPVIKNQLLSPGGSLTVSAKHPLSENEFFFATVESASPSEVGAAQRKGTFIEAGCTNLNPSTLPKVGGAGSFQGLFPGMPTAGGGGTARYEGVAVGASAAARQLAPTRR